MSEGYLQLDGRHSIRMVTKHVTGREGLGRCQLRFAVEFTAQDTTAQGAELMLRAEVSVGQARKYLGVCEPLSILRLLAPGQYLNEDFVLDLDPRQLAAIEEVRTAEQLDFNLDVRGFASHAEGKHEVYANLTYNLGLSDWLNLLEHLGYGKRLLVELPVPDPRTQPSRSKALLHFTKAQWEFAAGRYKEAAMECRHALDVLSQEAELAGDTYKELRLEIDNTKRDELGKAPRFQLVRLATKAVADLAAHPEVDTLDRHDTAALIAMVGGILHQGSASD